MGRFERATTAVLFALLLAAPGMALASDRHYEGSVQTQWLDDGRTMKLLAPFDYIGPDGTDWDAPAGSVVEGASIPKLA